jgi:hypothetical protein
MTTATTASLDVLQLVFGLLRIRGQIELREKTTKEQICRRGASQATTVNEEFVPKGPEKICRVSRCTRVEPCGMPSEQNRPSITSTVSIRSWRARRGTKTQRADYCVFIIPVFLRKATPLAQHFQLPSRTWNWGWMHPLDHNRKAKTDKSCRRLLLFQACV